MGSRSFNVNGVTGHPDRNLSEPALYSFSEVKKEIPVLLCVGDIHEDAHQFVTVHLSGVLPLAFYSLSFRGDRAKFVTKFNQRVGNEAIRHRTAIVKPKRE